MANGFGRMAPLFVPPGGTGRGLAQMQLGANVLALPARIQAAHQQAAIDRALLGRLGFSQAEQQAFVPNPPLSLPGGVAGKALSGVGTFGSVLTAALGQPVAAPRVSLGQLLQVEALRPGIERRRAYGRMAEQVAEAEDLTDEALLKDLAATFLRAGDASSAAKMIRERGRTTGGDLQGAIARTALRASGAKAGTPAGDQAILMMYASFEGMKAFFRERAALTGDIPAMRAQQEALRGAASVMAKGVASEAVATKQALRGLKGLIPKVSTAVERQIKADGFFSSYKQAGRRLVQVKSPNGWAKWFDVVPTQEDVDDWSALESLRATAGAFLEGAKIEKGGRYTDQDIERALLSLPNEWDTDMHAKGKWKIWVDLINDLSTIEVEEELTKALDPIVQKLIDVAKDYKSLGTEESGLTADMVDDFEERPEDLTGTGGKPEGIDERRRERMRKMLERMERKYEEE